MNFMFRLRSHSHDILLLICKYSNIWKKKNPETLLLPRISEKGHSTCSNLGLLAPSRVLQKDSFPMTSYVSGPAVTFCSLQQLGAKSKKLQRDVWPALKKHPVRAKNGGGSIEGWSMNPQQQAQSHFPRHTLLFQGTTGHRVQHPKAWVECV